MATNPGSPADSAHAATVWQWIAVGVIAGGSVLGGIALIEWVWPAFWTGVGLMVGGTVMAWRARVMDAVSVWSPPQQPRPSQTGGGSSADDHTR